MTFKLRSEVNIKYKRETGEWPETMPVFSRERIVRPGTVFKMRGSVSEDSIEGKGPWEEVNAKLRILDEGHLKVSFSPKKDLVGIIGRFLDLFSEPHLYLEDEVIEGEELNRVSTGNLWLWARSVDLYHLPDTFTLEDKLHLPFLIAAKKASIEGSKYKDVEKRTDLIYEPIEGGVEKHG